MATSRAAPSRRSEHAVKALGMVFAGATVHLLLAHGLFFLMVPNPVSGQRGAISLAVLFTALAALGFLYMRTQYSSPDHVARTLPSVFALLPPLAVALFLPVTLPTSLPRPDLMPVAGSVLAATWAPALLVSMLLSRTLRRLAIQYPPESEEGVVRTVAPPTIAGSYIWVLTLATGAAALAVGGMVIAALPDAPLAKTLTAGTGMLVLVALAAAAGLSLGQSPGQDVVSIAQRLDALGYNTRQTMASPIVVTSFDEVGELLSQLEELRVRLEEEIGVYQQALDKTKAADALKADFLSAVSHELRTPLNAVGGFAQLLLEGAATPLSEAQSEDVRLIQAGGKQLLELINDILDMSMIESGELRLSFAPTDLAEVIRDVVGIHQPQVRDKSVTLEAELGPRLPGIVCDRRRINQILTNLVSNAIKFTEDGTITLRAAFDPRMDRVVIRCIDTGIGIEADELDGIFEEYRQAGSVKRRKKGTGLGLAIARSIAQHHGGSLTVESSAGQGSTFTLSLPLDPPDRPAAIDVAEEAALQAVRKSRTGEVPIATAEAKA